MSEILGWRFPEAWVVGLILLVALITALRHRRVMVHFLATLGNHAGSGLIGSALLIIYVFNRVIGSPKFWKAALGAAFSPAIPENLQGLPRTARLLPDFHRRAGPLDHPRPAQGTFLKPAAMFHIVLVEPEIPHNAGAAGRLALATGSTLHLVEPLGFSLDDKHVRRTGLDYWQDVKLRVWKSFGELLDASAGTGAAVLVSQHQGRRHALAGRVQTRRLPGVRPRNEGPAGGTSSALPATARCAFRWPPAAPAASTFPPPWRSCSMKPSANRIPPGKPRSP